MIGTLNDLVDLVDRHTDEPIDLAGFARSHGTTEYHLRRMFAALAGLPFSEYVRRRRMTLAATDLVSGGTGLLDIAVRYGYSSVEAFGRAFRSVHGGIAVGRADSWRPFHNTSRAQVPPDRRREPSHGRHDHRPTRVRTRRPCSAGAAHVRGHQSAYPATHRVDRAAGTHTPQVAQRRRTRGHPGDHGRKRTRCAGGHPPDHLPARSCAAGGFGDAGGSVEYLRGRRRMGHVPLDRALPPRRCRTHGLRPRPNGSRRIRGVCDPGPRSCATWS